MKLKLSFVLVISLLALGCSSIPFVGDDDDDAPKPKKEKIEKDFVYVSKGELQCEDDTGDELKVSKARLEGVGIRVYSSDCAVIEGKMQPSLCGTTKLDINVHEINENHFTQAEKLGFKPIDTLKEQDLKYKTIPCDL